MVGKQRHRLMRKVDGNGEFRFEAKVKQGLSIISQKVNNKISKTLHSFERFFFFAFCFQTAPFRIGLAPRETLIIVRYLLRSISTFHFPIDLIENIQSKRRNDFIAAAA